MVQRPLPAIYAATNDPLDLPLPSRTRIAEEFDNEQAHRDGEIFRKIRYYCSKKDIQGENKWWARLSDTKRKDLRQLLKDERYAKAFDSMLPWQGMWMTVKLGSLHRLLTMKCDEVSGTPKAAFENTDMDRNCCTTWDTSSQLGPQYWLVSELRYPRSPSTSIRFLNSRHFRRGCLRPTRLRSENRC